MKRRWWTMLAALALIGTTSGLLAYWKANQRLGEPGVKVVPVPIHDPDGKVVGETSVYLPPRVLDYSSEAKPITPLELDWLPKDTTYGRRVYWATDKFGMMVNVVLMGTDRTSIHKPQYCLTGQGWAIEKSERTTVSIERPYRYELPVMKLTASSMREVAGEKVQVRGLYVYWFVADGQLTADHGERMWWMARDLIRTGRLQRWAYASCFAECYPGQEEAVFERMKPFLTAAVPEFQTTAGPPVQPASAPPSRTRP